MPQIAASNACVLLQLRGKTPQLQREKWCTSKDSPATTANPNKIAGKPPPLTRMKLRTKKRTKEGTNGSIHQQQTSRSQRLT